MRRFLCLLLVSGIVAVPGLVRADDPPTTAAPDAKESPSEAWSRIRRETGRMPYAARRTELQKRAEDYVKAFADRGGIALGEEAMALGTLQNVAQRYSDAAGTFRLVWANAENEDALRDKGAASEAQLLGNSKLREEMGEAKLAAAVKALLTYAKAMGEAERVPARSSIEAPVSYALDAQHREKEGHALRLAIVKRDPMQVARMYRALGRDLLHETHAMDGYGALVKEAQDLQALLLTQQDKAVKVAEQRFEAAIKTLQETSPASVTDDGDLVAKPIRQMTQLERVAFHARRSRESARSYVNRLKDFSKPFGMLGKPAPDWTLDKAFGDVTSLADVKGKVVVLDFWATWCPWCIRSFPAIRDLMRDYKDRGLVVVGVTASAPNVFAERYSLDEDMKEKAQEGQRVQPAARLARGSEKPDGETVFGPDEYPAKEKEVIATFIANHEMTWPVVMIDKQEPAPKYALTGWPHAVIIDRQGRIRTFKSGALLRDRPEDVKRFRKLLEDLLAEEKPGS